MADQSRSIVWIGPGTGLTITRVRTATGAGTIQTDMLAVSNADYNDYWEGDLVINSSPAPTNAEYRAITARALLNFLCADGTSVQLAIPAPQIGIFLADGVTVDASTITTLIADCIGNLESTTGSLATSFLGGFLNTR